MDEVESMMDLKNDKRISGNSIVRVRAQVMMRDDSTGGWVPMGGGGLSNVSVRKRKVHHEENDQPCKHEYLIHGRRISDQTVVLSCTIKKDFEYNKVMPTFHHWKTGNKKFGLTFQTAADARAFDKGVRLAIEDLLDGISEITPLHRYSVEGMNDDDVFMQLDLPVDKSSGDIRSPALSSGGRSPSPMEALDPSSMNTGSTTIVTVPPKGLNQLQGKLPYGISAAPAFGMKCHLSLPPMVTTSTSPTSSSSIGSSPFSNQSEFMAKTSSPGGGGGVGGSSETHTTLQFQKSSSFHTGGEGGGGGSGGSSSLDKRLDKDYSYVKFLRREPVHEYSYPKLADCAVSPATTVSNTSYASNTKNIYHALVSTVTSSSSTVIEDDHRSTSTAGSKMFSKELPASKSESGGAILNRHNNNGSRYKLRSGHGKSQRSNMEQDELLKKKSAGSNAAPSGSLVLSDEKSSSLMVRSSGSSLSSACSSSNGDKRSYRRLPFPHPLFSKSKRHAASKFDASKEAATSGSNDLPSSMTLTCAYCRESFSGSPGINRRGDCAFAPSRVRKCIETVTCLSCAKCLHYHCMSDSEGDYVHPCDCSNSDGHCGRRWIGLSLLAVLVPCLLCYLPLMSCYACGEKCNVCGGRHEAAS